MNRDLENILDADVPAKRALEMANAIKRYLVVLTEDESGDENNLEQIERAVLRSSDLIRSLEALARRKR